MMIQYPKTCIAVKTFVLQHGSANYLKSFQQKPSNFQTAAAAAAHTFCAACGVHMMHALQPDATELYVNVRCLTRGSFVTKPVSSKKQSQSGVEQNKEPAIVSQQQPDISMISSIPESVERIVSPPHVVVADDNIDDDDPLFTVTAASSISKSFSSTGTSDDYYREDRSSNTAELEQATYRLRKALLSSSPDKSRISVPPRRHHHRHQTDDSSEADEQSSSESFVALGPKTPMLQVPTAVAAVAIGNGGAKNNYRNPNMMGSFTNLESSPAAASEKEGADKKAVAATLSTTSTSFQEESVSSAPSVEESREQLRRFMSKHVTTSPARK